MVDATARALLALVGKHPGITPSAFAYVALDAGLINCRTGRCWRPQGAGRIGGGLLAKLTREGWVRGGGNYGRQFTLTELGLAFLGPLQGDCDE